MSKSKGLSPSDLKALLDAMADRFNQPAFIVNDPISIPHRFTRRQDIEVAGLFAATLAWGQRVTIIRSCERLLRLMDNAPYDFVMNHKASDLKRLDTFVHRTFNGTDLLYFIAFLQSHYRRHSSLEVLFEVPPEDLTVERGLIRFHREFFSLPDYPERTRKHVATPERKSACKRLNMYLRWMVRSDNRGVDFGLWQRISPAQLVCPCDLHVERVARRLKLVRRKGLDWLTALELTENLRRLDPTDPVRYDFALFGMGITNAELQRDAGGRCWRDQGICPGLLPQRRRRRPFDPRPEASQRDYALPHEGHRKRTGQSCW